MSAWRVIITDSESLSGVAPACPSQDDPAKHSTGFAEDPADTAGVYDCCPGPHIECWSEEHAATVARILSDSGAEVVP